MDLHAKITALRAMPEFGALRGQLECDRLGWEVREKHGEVEFAGEGTAKAAVFAALLELVGDYPHATPPAIHLSIDGLLSKRERELCALMVAGKTIPQITKAWEISAHTVRNHLKHVFKKLGVRSQIALVALLRNGGQ